MSAPARGDLLDVSKGEVRYTLGAEHPPVATVAPGTRIRLETELNIGDVLHSVDERFDASMVNLPFVNPVTGPVAVEGATPASVLVCRIEEMEVLAPGFTALVPRVRSLRGLDPAPRLRCALAGRRRPRRRGRVGRAD